MTGRADVDRRSRRAHQRPWRRRAAGLLRVGLVLATAGLAVAMLAARGARAQMAESAAVAGRQLAEFEDLTAGAHRLLLNGEAVYVAVRTTSQSPPQVMARFRNRCETAGLGLLHRQGEQEGLVACLVPRPSSDYSPVLQRLGRFAATGDLQQIGSLRYAYARKIGEGRTRVVTCWTDGPFRLLQLLSPSEAEAETNSKQAPRPEGAARLLRARIEGAPYAVALYASSRSADHALAEYEANLLARGWRRLPLPVAAGGGVGAFARFGLDILVSVSTAGRGSSLCTVQMPSRSVVAPDRSHL